LNILFTSNFSAYSSDESDREKDLSFSKSCYLTMRLDVTKCKP
jgi:hypothetical protein